MSNEKPTPEWWVIKTERRVGGDWIACYLAHGISLTPDVRGAMRFATFPDAAHALYQAQSRWDGEDVKWRARVVGLRLKGAKS